MIGPNARPIALVPKRWIKNKKDKMITVIMITSVCDLTGSTPLNLMPFKPSIAVVTVTAGVNIPSASNAAPPINAG